jgi:hypothetical protein
MSDEELKERLLNFKGVGTWTAEMLLMMVFGRKEVFSPNELGMRQAMFRHHIIDPSNRITPPLKCHLTVHHNDLQGINCTVSMKMERYEITDQARPMLRRWTTCERTACITVRCSL